MSKQPRNVEALIESVDCLSEDELNNLADIKPGTAEAWRKRGKGPAYVLLGNRYLYPRSKVSTWLREHVRERRAVHVKGVL